MATVRLDRRRWKLADLVASHPNQLIRRCLRLFACIWCTLGMCESWSVFVVGLVLGVCGVASNETCTLCDDCLIHLIDESLITSGGVYV